VRLRPGWHPAVRPAARWKRLIILTSFRAPGSRSRRPSSLASDCTPHAKPLRGLPVVAITRSDGCRFLQASELSSSAARQRVEEDQRARGTVARRKLPRPPALESLERIGADGPKAGRVESDCVENL